MAKTKTVKTNNLEVQHPGRDRAITWSQGSVKSCAEFAPQELQRVLRRTKAIAEDACLPDAEYDKLEAELRKNKKAEAHGYKFQIVAEDEEFELDENDDENDTDDLDEEDEA